MTVETLEGDREIIEKALDEYGRVVTGEITPEQYTDDRLLLIELKSELRTAANKIETQKELLKYQDEQIKKKDIQIDKFLNIVENGIQSGKQNNPSPAKQLINTETKIFISYGERDKTIANKLYHDLKNAGATPWMDTENILPGKDWKIEITQAIKNSTYFLLLLSSESLSTKGYVHKEQKIALEILDEFPQNHIFIIPVRLNNCIPSNENLEKLQWIDFDSYDDGLEKILHVLTYKE